MTKRPIVLFVCVHNAGRSQMAAGWLGQLAGAAIEVRSAGSQPASQLNPTAVAAMAEVGIDIAGGLPKMLTSEQVLDSDVVITMGCGDSCPIFAGKRYLDWVLPDPAGQSLQVVRGIRDEIRDRVRGLIAELLPAVDELAGAIRIVPMTERHADRVIEIYQAGIAEGDATFETTAPSWQRFTASHLPEHRFVALAGDREVVGWVVASAVSDRCAYAGVVEHSVYVDPAARGRGAGRALLEALISSTEAAGIWTVQSGIFPENEASAALHRAAGFRTVGRRERIGRQDGRWRDVLLIERRSSLL